MEECLYITGIFFLFIIVLLGVVQLLIFFYFKVSLSLKLYIIWATSQEHLSSGVCHQVWLK